MAAVAQIVSAFGSSGSVLLDLNAAASSSGVMLGDRDSIQLASVELARQSGDRPVVWTPSDPESLATRKISVPLVIWGTNADDLRAKVGTLFQLVSAPFILKLQRHLSSVPVWLRCWPTVPKMQPNVVGAGQGTALQVGTLEAETEPYAIGARVDVGPIAIGQDPSTGTAWVWDINNVAGDALTPLVIRSTDSNVTNAEDQIHISVRRRGTPSALTGLAVQGETITGATVSGTPAASVGWLSGDSAMSGSGALQTTYPATMTSSSHVLSFSVAWPSLAGVEAPGLYRLLMRVRRGGGAAGKAFSILATVGPQQIRESFTAGGNNTRVLDLGLVQAPSGQPLAMAAPEGPSQVAATNVAVTVTKTWTGSGTFDVDWVALVPADQGAGILTVAAPVPGAGTALVLDGYDHTPRVFSSDPYGGGTPQGIGTYAAFIGGAPRLRPGANRLYVVAGLGLTASSSRSPSVTLTLSGSYWPKFGWLA